MASIPTNRAICTFTAGCRQLVQFSSLAQSNLTLCDPTDCSILVFSVHHKLPELTQTHVH